MIEFPLPNAVGNEHGTFSMSREHYGFYEYKGLYENDYYKTSIGDFDHSRDAPISNAYVFESGDEYYISEMMPLFIPVFSKIKNSLDTIMNEHINNILNFKIYSIL